MMQSAYNPHFFQCGASDQRLGAPAAPKELHLLVQLPLLHTGKPDRRAVADAVRRGAR